MAWTSDKTAYGTAARIPHWTIAAAFLALFATGMLFEELPKPSNVQDILLHKSLGITVLVLSALRLVLAVFDRARPDGAESGSARLPAAAVKVFLYAAGILLPLSGWALSSASGRGVSWFQILKLPNLLAADKPLAEALELLHAGAAFLVGAAVLLHAAAALRHHFVLRDGVLLRMIGKPKRPEPSEDSK